MVRSAEHLAELPSNHRQRIMLFRDGAGVAAELLAQRGLRTQLFDRDRESTLR